MCGRVGGDDSHESRKEHDSDRAETTHTNTVRLPRPSIMAYLREAALSAGRVMARRSVAGGVDGGRLAADGQDEPEGRASFGPIERPDTAAVGLDDGAADRESQSRPASLGPRASVELFEDAILLARGQAGPPISNLHDGLALLGPSAHVDLRARRRVLGRVLEQVDEHLLEQHLVHGNEPEVGAEEHTSE